jgi:hypothetical protein
MGQYVLVTCMIVYLHLINPRLLDSSEARVAVSLNVDRS